MTQRDSGNSGLPAGYYLCEYIEATGTQYIDTGFKHNQNTRVVMKAQMVGTPTSYSFLFDGPQADGQRKGILYYIDDKAWVVDYGLRSARQTLSAGMNDLLEIDYNKNVCTVNGETKTFTISSFQSTVNLALFCSNWNNIPQAFMTGRMYYCQIYDNGKKIRDYIPCVSPEGDFGLYDAVTKAFFKNASGGVGFRGKVVLPQEYTWLEYIYSGGNAWIDTGYQHDQKTRVVMRAQMVGTPTADAYFFGGASSSDKYKDVFYHKNTGYIMATYGASGDYTYVQAGVNNLLEIDYDGHICSVSVVNGGTEAYQFDPGLFQSTVNLALFCSNYNNSPRGYMTGRLYLCEIWDRGTLIRLYIPCVNKNSVYGLYDMVEGKFYSSAGTGQFGEEPVAYDFAYTGGEQSVTLKPGTYKLECWGAQGGSYNQNASEGGKGGYISGVYKVENNTDVYINVGGQGLNSYTGNKGGYNGGGDGGPSYYEYDNGAGGGGATHIATVSGLLSQVAKGNLIIVAGAGGGAVYGGSPGGVGGGLTIAGHGNGIGFPHDGEGGFGGQAQYGGGGGAAGEGYVTDENDGRYYSYPGGGGGAGYYGGGGGGSGGIDGVNPRVGVDGESGGYGYGGAGGQYATKQGYDYGYGGSGGGGTSYVASNLTSVTDIRGDASMPSITGGTETGHANNGYARITKIA